MTQTNQQASQNQQGGLFRAWPKALLAAGIAAALALPAARANTINVLVPGTSDLYLAGQPDGSSLGPDTTDNNAAILVSGLSLTPGSSLTFAATGAADGAGCTSPTPDGCSVFSTGPANGISTYNNGPAQALIGVFLDGSVPSGSGPSDTADIDPNAASVSPALNVVFFIGDGLTGTGSGATQTFVIPTGATRLFLANSDGAGGGFNNSGSFSVDVTSASGASTAPEPATWSLLVFAGGALGLIRRRAQ